MRELLLSAFFLFCPLPAAAAAPPADQREELMRSLLDTFLAANDLPGALETAKKAETLYPHSDFWVKKSAELSLWSGDSKGALQAYKRLLSIENTPELRRKVAGLAVGSRDFETALYALELDLAADDLEKADDLIYIYEQLGRPEKAAELIEKYSFRFNSPQGYAKSIELLTNMGEVQQAESRYRTSIGKFGLSTGTAHGYAELLSAKQDLRGALEILKKAESKAGPGDSGFWNMLGDLSWYFGDIATGVKAAQFLDAAGTAQEKEYDRLSAYHTATGHPELAELTYEKGWRQTGRYYFLMAWLNSMAARGYYSGAGEVIRGLTREQETQAGQNQYYWTLKALTEAAMGSPAGALAAYDAALDLSPDSEEVKIQLLWFLASSGLGRQLKDRLGPLSAGGSELAAKQLALSYAYLRANDSGAALSRIAAYRRLERGAAQAELEADAQEAAGDPDTAQELRFGRWLELSKARRNGRFSSDEEAAAWLRLCAKFCAAPRFTAELSLLAPALSREASVSARLGRASQQGEEEAAFRLARMLPELPDWLKLSEALNYNDTAQLGRLLESSYYSLPHRDRITALERLGLLSLARAETAEMLWKNGGDLFLNQKAAELLDPAAASVNASVFYRARKDLETSAAAAAARVPAGERLTFTAGGSAYKRTAASGGALLLSKKEDTEGWAGALWDGKRWDAAARAGGRDAARRFFFASAEAARSLRSGGKAEFSAAYGSRSDESSYLETAGMKDLLSVYFSGRLRGPYSYRAGTEAAQLFSQDRKYAGRLNSYRAELARRGRLPGWEVSTRVSYQNASAASAPGAKGTLDAASPYEGTRFSPASFNQYGAGLTLTRDGYRLPMRRLSPYLSADYYYNSSFLGGFGARAGASCSPWGRNIMELWLEYAKGYKGAGDEVKSAGVSLTAYF